MYMKDYGVNNVRTMLTNLFSLAGTTARECFELELIKDNSNQQECFQGIKFYSIL